MAAAITDEKAEPITVSLKQKQDDFQTAGEINIGGITKANTSQWTGYPHAEGSAKVSHDPDLGAVINRNGGAVISSIGTRRGTWSASSRIRHFRRCLKMIKVLFICHGRTNRLSA